MAVGISTYLANKILDHVFRNVTYTPPTTIYWQAHVGDPGPDGTANVSASTTRHATTFNAAASGQITLSNTPEHTLTATETISHATFWDAPTGGNFLYSAQASVAKGGNSGDIIRLASDTISLTPLAA